MTRLLLVFVLLCSGPIAWADDCVVLLHGLARVSNSMSELETKLGRAGYIAQNIHYPSRRYSVQTLAADAVGRGVAQCREENAETIHFVAHSLGGILVRQYLTDYHLAELGRVVMLGTPNQGAVIAERLDAWPGFSFLGPSAEEISTGAESIIPDLAEVNFELGVIAGDINVNPLAAILLDEPNDSVVTVSSTRVENMTDHLVLPVIHTIMMRDNDVIDNTIHFLKTGQFIPQ
ncbi:MAG: alpha/beta hydrolase [Gammaproteobacteria bacterium]